jgi:TonB family protein
VRDADFINKVTPNYPYIGKEQLDQGIVAVVVVVGAKGIPIQAWTNWSVTTGQAEPLQKAAMDAVMASRFTPPYADDRPTNQEYVILYTFSLDGMPDVREPLNDKPCLISLSNPRAEVSDSEDLNNWYSLQMVTDSDDIASVSLNVKDTSGKISTMSTASLALKPFSLNEGPGSGMGSAYYRGPHWAASVTFSRPQADIAALWVTSFAQTNGEVTTCPPVISVPSNLWEAGPNARIISIAVPAQPSPQSLLPAAFSTERWPAYPTDASGKRVGGHVDVETIVDSKGRALEAFVMSSSGITALDQAALTAATQSTYVPPATGTTGFYQAIYRFIP